MKNDAEKLFLKYKKENIKLLGKNAMYDDQFKQLIPFINGVYCQDNAIVKQGFYIINTDMSTGKGKHWVACYQTKTRVYLYDSFARTPSFLLPLFVKKINNKGLKIVESDITDKEQYGHSEVCGQLCCAWLRVIKEQGIRKALTI